MGLSNQYAYPYCAATRQDPIDGYGTAVISVTREVSEKYDLDGIFQNKCLVGFLSEPGCGRGQRNGRLSDGLGRETRSTVGN
jgi:hypothetical protein